MSDFVNRPGMGTLFPNSYKDTDSRPDYKGSLTLTNGEVVKFAAWNNQGAKGPYLSLKIDKPRPDAAGDFRPASAGGVAGGGGGQEAQRETGFDLDDSIPFARCDTVW